MNTIKFETSKVFGVFVKDITPEFTDLHPQYSHYLNQGFVSNLTDEQKEDVIPNVDMTGYGKLFPNYLDDEGTLFMDVDPSFETLLTSLNVLLVNPLQDEWDEVCTWGHGSNITYAEYMEVGKNVGKWILLTCNK